MAAVPAGQPGVHPPGAGAGARPARRLSAAWLAAALAAAAALGLAIDQGAARPGALQEIARAGLAAVVLFGVSGYAATRVLLPGVLRVHLALFVLPIGAAISGLALTVLGLLHVPLTVSIMLVVGAGAGAAAATHLGRGGGAGAPGARRFGAALPLFVAALVAAIVLIPTLRLGFPTVFGQNGDAVLVVGTAELLQEAPPTATRPELPLDSVPLVWRSKLPIYYTLAATAQLSGLDAVQTFPTMTAVATALLALGIFALAFHALGAGLLAATAAMLVVALDRIVLLSALQPHYNQLWGLFALAFLLLFGWRFLAAPAARTGALLALFVAATLFIHPLLLPYVVVFLAAAAWRARGHLRRPRLRVPRWALVAGAVAAVPVALVLVRGVVEKGWAAAKVVLPGSSLAGWDSPTTKDLPLARFFGVSDPDELAVVGLALVAAGAILALRRAEPVARAGLAALSAAGLAIALLFWAREGGDLFWFKALSFIGPVILMLGVAGLAGTRHRAATLAAAALAALVLFGARSELDVTTPHADANVLALRDWDARLPPGRSVRIDVPPGGFQLWSWYFLDSRPVSTANPLRDFFPFPQLGLKADYVLWDRSQQPQPRGTVGPPVLQNDRFVLHRLDPRTPGPDLSSRRLRWDVTEDSL